MQAPLTLGKYPVLGTLGRGGSGIVYRSEEPGTGRALALKTCTGKLRAERSALEREIAALGRLTQKQRPGVVQLLDAGTTDGKPWYAMPLIAGQSLRAYAAELWSSEPRLAGGGDAALVTAATLDAGALASPAATSLEASPRPKLPEGRRAAAGKLSAVLELGLALTESLHWIHDDGVVHGDLTPGNVLRQADGQPVLVDFGTAFQLYEGELMREVAQDAAPRVGTPGYMAPEQIRGQGVDPRSDLYALGCLLYELVTGEPPFRAPTPTELLRQHLSLAPRAPRELVRELSPELDALLLALLDKLPRRRPSRADDVMLCLSRLLKGSTAGAPKATAGAAALYRPQLVGRDAVLDELTQLLPREPGVGGSCVCLRAPSGTGKTRLLNELRARATALGCDVVAISCRKADGIAREQAPSLIAFGSVLGQLAERALASAQNDASLLEALAVLAPYAPGELSGLGLPAQRNVAILADVPRSLEVVLRACVQGAPLLLVLDDLQWADELTLLFARERLVALAGAGLLAVVSYRSDEIGERLAPFEAAARRIELPPLELPHVYAIARDMLATEAAPEGLPELLLGYSAGNPFLVAEYLRAAVARGLLLREPGGEWLLRRESGLLDSVPDSLQGLLLLRVKELSVNARTVLELASVLGREIDARELALLAHDVQHVAALEELTREQVLEYVGEGRYRFVHDKLCEALELALEGERRRELHRLVATALESAVDASDAKPERAARLGTHWAAAGDAQKALGYLRIAADGAQVLHAHARAAALLRLALVQCQSLRAMGDGVASIAAELQERLGDSLLAQASHADARQAYEQALALVDESSRLVRARNLRKMASSHWRVHAHAQAHEKLQEAEATLGVPATADPPELHREYIEIQLGKFERLYFARDTSSAAQSLLQALESRIALYAEPGQRVRYYLCAASDAMARSRYFSSQPALTFARQGTSVRGELLTRSEEALAQFIEGFALMLGDEAERREALEHFERAEQGATRAGDRTLSSRVAMYQALTLLRLGDVAGTSAASQRALELAEIAKMGAYAAAAHACAAWALWRAPESDAVLVRGRAEEAQRLWRGNPANYPFRWCLGFVLLELALREQNFEAVGTALEQLLDPMQQQFPPALEAELRQGAAAIVEDRRADAARAVDQALRLAQRFGFC